jgi:hypothetical protein
VNTVILTAGKALRLGALAPQGCKVLVSIKGETVLHRQLAVLAPLSERVTVVCRSEHAPLLQDYPVDLCVHDAFDGPTGAFRATKPTGDTLLCYGDTLCRSVPDGTDWVGIGFSTGPRRWDVIEHGHIKYRWVDEYEVAKVCVGLYRFARPEKLKLAEDMPHALHHSPDWLRFKVVPGWCDTGDVAAVRALEGAA